VESLFIGFGVDCDSFDAECTTATDDAHSNFAAIGDQYFGKQL
jgi:hypothetical protein